MTKITEVFQSPITVAITIVLSILSIGTTHKIYTREVAFLERRIASLEESQKNTSAKLTDISVNIEALRGDTRVILARLEGSK